MINPNLYTKPVAVDNVLHRSLKAGQLADDWSVAGRLNAIFVTAVEFGDVSSEFPIVFVNAGTSEDGKRQVAPIAVFGLGTDENLFVDGKVWRARYQPALLRAYPFGIGRADGNRVMVVIDELWRGWSQNEGQALFESDGRPTAFMASMREYLDKVETEIQRTRLFGQALVDADLLTEMRFDATLPDGKTVTVDGFLTVDDNRLGALPDAKVVEFHRNGVLGLIHAHQMSLRHMRQLVEWRAARATAAQS